MFSIGLLLFVSCLIIGAVDGSKGYDSNKHVSKWSARGFLIGFGLMVTSVVVYLWGVLP